MLVENVATAATLVIRVDPDGRERLQNTITPFTRFFKSKLGGKKEMDRPTREKLARVAMDSWQRNGPYPGGTKWKMVESRMSDGRAIWPQEIAHG